MNWVLAKSSSPLDGCRVRHFYFSCNLRSGGVLVVIFVFILVLRVRACVRVCVCVCVCVCFAHILLKISGSTRDRRGERSEVAPDVVLPARPSGRFWWRPGNVARAAAVATAAANEAAAVV